MVGLQLLNSYVCSFFKVHYFLLNIYVRDFLNNYMGSFLNSKVQAISYLTPLPLSWARHHQFCKTIETVTSF